MNFNDLVSHHSSVTIDTGSLYMNGGRWIYFKDTNNDDNLYIGRANDTAGSLAIGAGARMHFNAPYIYSNHICLRNNQAIAGLLTSGSLSSILRMNTSNQVELTWTTGGLKGRVKKLIWSGNAGTNATISIPEMPYYNVFLAKSANMDKLMIGVRGDANASIAFGISWASASFVYTMGCELKLNNGAGSTSGTLVTQPWHHYYDGTNSFWAYDGNLVKIYGLL